MSIKYCFVILSLSRNALDKFHDAILEMSNHDSPEACSVIEKLTFMFEDAVGTNHRRYGSVSYSWLDLEWNKALPEIAFIEWFLKRITEQDYDLIKIGETQDDIDHQGNLSETQFLNQLLNSSYS
jgi:hypothetical protein